MCGIAAVYDARAARRRSLTSSILHAMAHRGHHRAGRRTADRAEWATTLGTNRLPIVGHAAGDQPVLSPRGRYLVAFNGEVFNYQELSRRLGEADRSYAGLPDSDTAVLAAAIEHWGPEAATPELVWEGAYLCLDTESGVLWAARDHLGIKPLYWTAANDTVLWASEIRALTPHATGTVEPVAPGSLLRWAPPGTGAPTTTTWWAPEEHSPLPENEGASADAENKEETVLRLGELLREAVRARTPRTPYAVALSGGLDSSLILRLAHEANDQVTAYVLNRPDSPDLPYAEELCRLLDVPLVRVTASETTQLYKRLPEVIRTVETWEWQVVNHAAPMSDLMGAIQADGHRVVLTGEGADELFCGYGQPVASDGTLQSERLARVRNLHRTNCRRLDRMGMQATLECRVPFLDRTVTEFALGLHSRWMVRDGRNKWVLRAMAHGVLPQRIAERKKLSFARGVGYEYSPQTVSSVFGALQDDEAVLPAEWAQLPRYPSERLFLRHFLDCGYGAARYLRSRSV
ncbi:asparagine synthetase B family protein [Streptomyces barkulensis]|uniref:asparagine synthetase B family protein n=1 Tax=Streptomyces barkulensis TaxID=1257026 RepID=UPI000C6E1BA4|nr:asparagine synthase-related protein [Streptomyces barkulensis]